MPKFGNRSLQQLATCDERLQKIFNEIIKYYDCSILEGHRGEEAQNKAYTEGKSKLQYPFGKHNKTPSLAVDAMPYPIDWNDKERTAFFAGLVIATGKSMGIEIRWGHDWNRNFDLKDEKFIDAPHYELID